MKLSETRKLISLQAEMTKGDHGSFCPRYVLAVVDTVDKTHLEDII